MFDQHSLDWQQDLAPGDVVLYRFPTTEDLPDGEAPKMRPCLVLDTPRLAGKSFAKLAYGRKGKKRKIPRCATLTFEIELLGIYD